jgi:serine-type D-Ala-D-Ala carboxypeptidase (penicillin-binding protein 5/6)
MDLNIAQRLLLNTLFIVLWLFEKVDRLNSFVVAQITRAVGKTMVYMFAFGFVFFLAYSYMTGYISKIVVGMVPNDYAVTPNHNVMGASDVRSLGPVLVSKIDKPETTAVAILVIDRATAKTLYEQNSRKRLASASTTKLMTALVALDIFELSDLVTISEECAKIDSTKADLPIGQQFRVESLLNAMLVASAGDAACALATGKVGQDEFVYRMNQKAYQMGLNSSYFTNPVGLDGVNSSHFSTAQDLYKLADAAVKINVIKSIVAKKEYLVKSTNEEFIGKLESTNKLLSEIPQSVGVKTGTTTEAGQVLIYEYADNAKDLMIIVMGSEDRFTDVRALLNWTTASYRWL